MCDYKDGRYPHYFEVHSPMGSMRLRAEDAAGKEAWVSSLQKQAQVKEGRSPVEWAALRGGRGGVNGYGSMLLVRGVCHTQSKGRTKAGVSSA